MSEKNVKIRLLKDWENDGTKWPKGQLLQTDEQSAESLVEQKIAEIYEPKAGDQIVVSPVGNGGMTEDDIRKIIKGIIEETTKAETKKLGMMGQTDAEFTKKGGFMNFAHFAQQVYKAGPGQNESEMLNKWNQHCKATGLSESVNSDGGFLVPTEFKATLLRLTLEAAIVRPRALVLPMATNSLKIPCIAETSRASSFYSGIVIYRPGEAGTKTASKPKFGNIQLSLHKLIGLVYATDELLEDSPISLEPLLNMMFSEAIAWQEDDDFVHGTGAGMALGILNAPCLVSVAKETNQVAATIVTDNITKMWSRLYPRSQANAIWMAHNDTFPQLAKLNIVVGTGGGPAGLIASDVTAAPKMSILGKPLILTDHCQTLGTKGDIILADWRQYLIGQKAAGALKIDTSIHVNFVYDETAFRFVLRYDGQPWWKSALTPKRGTNTLSPFVALATRS